MVGSPKKRARREAEIKNLPMVIAQPEVEGDFKDCFGGSTKFKPEFIEIARRLAEGGATDKEIANKLGICSTTFYEWRSTIPLFQAVLLIGKEPANDRLERAAFDLAVGYVTTVTVNIKVRNSDGSEKVVEVQQEVRVAPNERMLQWMLKNRRPDVWKDRTEIGGGVEVVHLTFDQAKERLKARLQEIKSREEGGNQPAAG